MNETIRQTQKRYCSGALITAIAIAFTLILVGYKPLAKGLLLGTLFSILNFIIIGETLPAALGRTKRGAFIVSLASIGFRFFLMAIPLIVGIKMDAANVFAVIPGLLMVQITILFDHAAAGFMLHRPVGRKGKMIHG